MSEQWYCPNCGLDCNAYYETGMGAFFCGKCDGLQTVYDRTPPFVLAMQERIAALEVKWVQAIGWAYADCCTTLDAGGDPRQTEMPDVLRRATIDLKEQVE